MSHEGDGSERTQQRTVAELLAKYGNSSEGGAPRRRRRKPDDGSDTAPQAIIDRVMSDSGEMPAIREDQPPPERASHRQSRGARRAAPPPAPQPAPPQAEPPRRAHPPEPAARREPGEPMTEQLPRVPPAARRRRPEDAAPDGPPRKLPPRRVSAALDGTQHGIPAVDDETRSRRPSAALEGTQRGIPALDDDPADQPPNGRGPTRRPAAALEGTQRAIPALDDDQPEPPSNGRGPSLPRRAPGTSRMPQRAPKPMPAPPLPAPPKQPSQPLPAPQPSQQLPLPPQPSQALPKPPFPGGPTVTGMTPAAARTTEVGRPIRPPDYPGDAAQTEVDPQPPPPEFLEEHEAFDDKAARRFAGYTAHDDLDSPAAEELDGFDDLDELEPEAEVSPAKAWLTMVAQLALGVVGGAAVWLGFNWLWGRLPVAALVVAVVVTAGLVFIVRKIRRADDLNTTVLAVLVGLVVTVSPAMLLLIGR